MTDPPVPSWDEAAVRAGRRQGAISAIAGYEDGAVRKVCAYLGHVPLAAAVARESEARTGRPGCTFPVFALLTQFPVTFGAAKIRNVAALALPDLFDRFTTTRLFKEVQTLAEAHGADAPLALVFPYTGTAGSPGPKGGKFMTLHTFPSTPVMDRTRLTRAARLGAHKVTFTLETLEALMASFRDWEPPDF